MKLTTGLAQAPFPALWPIVAAVVMLIGISQWVIGQESSDFQHRNNTERTRQGLGAVSGNEILQKAAHWMAEDMAARHTLDHTDSQHRSLAKRLEDFGYEHPRLIAENIAEGQETASAVVNSWMQSPPHRANLLHPEVRHAGVSHAVNARGQHYWVLDLGTAFTPP